MAMESLSGWPFAGAPLAPSGLDRQAEAWGVTRDELAGAVFLAATVGGAVGAMIGERYQRPDVGAAVGVVALIAAELAYLYLAVPDGDPDRAAREVAAERERAAADARMRGGLQNERNNDLVHPCPYPGHPACGGPDGGRPLVFAGLQNDALVPRGTLTPRT